MKLGSVLCGVGVGALLAGAAVARPTSTSLVNDMNDTLRNDPALRDDRVEVVRSGSTLVLTGVVDSAEEKLRAADLARDVAGGDIRIQNKVTVASEDQAEGERREGTVERAGKAVDEAWITTKVKTQLTADEQIDFGDVDVATDKRVVTLTGTVRNQRARQRALDIARSTDGVERVVDQLRVGPRRRR